MCTNVLVILACCCCICCETLNVGRCPLSEYIKKTRTCTSQFIRGLQTNSSANCSILYDDMLRCIKDFVRLCLQGYRSESEIDAHLNESAKKLKTKADYCNNGTRQPPILSVLEKKGFPCVRKFFTENRKCTEKLRNKFRANPADPNLCSEFMRTKSCIKALMEKYCVLDQRTRSILNHAFDDYNPFCKVTFVHTDTASPPPTVTSREEPDERSWTVNPGSTEEHADMFGRCGVLAQLNRTRACTTAFVKSFQKDPLGNCSKLFYEMLDCVKCVIRSCLDDYFKGSEVTLCLKESINMTFYCGGMVDVPDIQTSSSSPACDQHYRITARGCLKTFNETFRLNASSPKLCSDFKDAKLCLREVIENHCSEIDVKSSAALEYTYIMDDYNPFCEGNIDFSQGNDPSFSQAAHVNISYLDWCVKTSTTVTERKLEVSAARHKSTLNANFIPIILLSVAIGLQLC